AGVFVPVILLFVLAIFASIGGSNSGFGGATAAVCMAFLLLIPASVALVYIFVRWTLVAPAIMVERLGAVDALRRSWRLVQNYWWRTAGLLILLGIMGAIISAGPAALVAGLVVLFTKS